MAAIDVTLAEAVKDRLNAETFSQGFTAVRRWLPWFDPEDDDATAKLENLQVTVCAGSVDLEQQNREESAHEYHISVAIQKRLNAADTADGDDPEIDGLVELVQELRDHLKNKGMPVGAPIASFLGIENKPLVDKKHLIRNRTFTSLIVLTYLKVR